MMKRRGLWGVLILCAALLLSGCGGESKVGVVSGTVTDIEGEPVANAEVFAANAVNSLTRSLHNGTYYLTNVPERFTVIRARAVINGVEYTGQNVAQVFENEQSKNVNIMIAPVSQQGTIEGFVRDAFGAGIEGARVFAGGALSSAFAITDRRGFYRITGLPSGYEYPIVASAPDYENDKRTAQVTAGQTTIMSFTLNRSVNRPVQTPLNLEATAWTMPRALNATRSPRERDAYNAIRALFDEKPRPRRAVATRSAGDYWIEVDLSWEYEEQSSLLGYGIYRGRTIEELNRNAIAFLRDPLADFFADLDPALQPNVNYFYEMVALNTDYLNELPGTVSGRSNRVSARPFAPIALTRPFPNEIVDGLILQWTPVPNADYYLVLIYDRFPDYNVAPYYPADLGDPGAAKVFAPATSLVYTGPALVSGRTYYAVVMAFTNDRNTRAISQIVPFQAR
ncbi:MAG: carboxypeptidase-like regulatory domain-containing protein [Fimbriimonadales bacterium]|nr:carboxypeptidase-like regulatory domain-containing protein [Fimbriimonadales bacterium]